MSKTYKEVLKRKAMDLKDEIEDIINSISKEIESIEFKYSSEEGIKYLNMAKCKLYDALEDFRCT